MNSKEVNLAVKKSDKKNKGASMVEYALMLALIAIIAIVAVTLLGRTVCQSFSSTASSMSQAG